MKVRAFGGILALAAVIGLGAAAQAEDSGPQALDAAWAKAMKAGDVDAVVALYAPDAVLWLPGGPEARGTKAIHDAYAGLLSANTVTDVSMSNTHYETCQNLSAGWGNFAMTLQPRQGGAPAVMAGRFTEVARRVKGKWHYVADHASADPAPAPAAKP